MLDLYYRIRYYLHDLCRGLQAHKLWMLLVAMVVVGQLGMNAGTGMLKSQTELDWIDILGEGATALFILVWLLIVLSIRSPGRVTNLFTLGLLGIFVSNFQDVMDEIYQLPNGVMWDSWVESVPVGLLILTVALWFWRTEQARIQSFMDRRGVVSQISQEPSTWDGALALPDYEAFLEKIDLNRSDQALMMVRLDNFDDVTYQQGGAESDQLMQSFAELLLLNLRSQDAMCRYAPGCFVILMAQMDSFSIQRFQQSLCWLLTCYCERVYQNQQVVSVSFGVSSADDHSWSKPSAHDSSGYRTSELWIEQARQNLTPFESRSTQVCEQLGC